MNEAPTGGGGSHNGDRQLERRLTVLETRFDTILPTLATKTDLVELRAAMESTVSSRLTETSESLRGEIQTRIAPLDAKVEKIAAQCAEIAPLSAKVEKIATQCAEHQEHMGILNIDLRDRTGAITTEMHKLYGTLDANMQKQYGTLDANMQKQYGTLDANMHREIGALRSDMQAQFTSVHKWLAATCFTLVIGIGGMSVSFFNTVNTLTAAIAQAAKTAPSR